MDGGDRRRWTVATAAGGAVSWAIAMCGVALVPTAPVVLLVVAAPVLAAALLLSIGTAQWCLLRRHVTNAWHWIAATAVAWVVALGVFTAVTTPLWQPDQSTALIAAIGVLGGLVMAATMSAVTGWAFVRLLRRTRPARFPLDQGGTDPDSVRSMPDPDPTPLFAIHTGA